MDRTAQSSSAPAYARESLVKPLQGVAALILVLVMIQAVLAGRGWYIDFDLIEIHGWIGNITFLAVVAQVALVFAIGIPGSLGKRLLILSAAVAVLVMAQTGLGYSGRDSAAAASWHIPVGVLIFGLAVAVAALASQLQTGDSA